MAAAATTAPRGGIYGGRPQDGLLPAPHSGATRVLDFIDGFKEKQKREKAEARAEFMELMEWQEKGIPIDQNKAARLARKGGLTFTTTGRRARKCSNRAPSSNSSSSSFSNG